MRLTSLACLTVTHVALIACATAPPPVAGSAEAMAPRVDSILSDTTPRPVRWTGTLNAVLSRPGSPVQMSTRSKTTGQVLLEAAGATMNRTRAVLSLITPATSASDYRWAVFEGRCGSNPLPLLGFDQFPSVDVGSNGRGEINVEIPLTLPRSGSLHVNIYPSGQQLSDVTACANLRREGGS